MIRSSLSGRWSSSILQHDPDRPIFSSALFTAATHPLILRVLYIDGDAYQLVYTASVHVQT